MVDGLSPWVKDVRDSYDLIVVGAVHSGLTAATYAARNGIDTLVIERAGAGARRVVVECVDNCARAPSETEHLGLGGRSRGHAMRFKLDMLTGRSVTTLRIEGDRNVARTDAGDEYRARVLLLAPGIRNRRLNVRGEGEPNTEFVRDLVDVDQRGFIKTGRNLDTNLEGVYTAGDARAGGNKQIESAVADGETAALVIRRYLENAHTRTAQPHP